MNTFAVSAINQERTALSQQACQLQKCFGWIVRAGVISIIVLGFVYLMSLNAMATLGFEYEEVKTERLELQKDLERIDISLAIPSSLYALESSEQIQEMPEVEDKHFLRVEDDQLAFVQ